MVSVSACVDDRFRIGTVNSCSRDSLRPCKSEWTAEEQRCRISVSSASVAACKLRRKSAESRLDAECRDAILSPSTSVGITRAKTPRPALGVGSFEVCRESRSSVRRTVLERISSSNTARGDTSPAYSFTSLSKENVPWLMARVFGRPFRVINRRSVSHPRTTRSDGIRVVVSASKPQADG